MQKQETGAQGVPAPAIQRDMSDASFLNAFDEEVPTEHKTVLRLSKRTGEAVEYQIGNEPKFTLTTSRLMAKEQYCLAPRCLQSFTVNINADVTGSRENIMCPLCNTKLLIAPNGEVTQVFISELRSVNCLKCNMPMTIMFEFDREMKRCDYCQTQHSLRVCGSNLPVLSAAEQEQKAKKQKEQAQDALRRRQLEEDALAADAAELEKRKKEMRDAMLKAKRNSQKKLATGEDADALPDPKCIVM